MQNFFQQIKNSVYGPDFYKNLEIQDFSYTAKYLLKLSFFTSFLSALVLIALFFIFRINLLASTGLQNMSEFGQKYVETYFPTDLVINFQNGVLSTNKTEPVIFPIPIEWFSESFESDDRFRNVLTISTNENITRDSFQKYDSFVILASTTGAVYDADKNSINFFNYKNSDVDINEIQNITVDKNFAVEKINSVSGYLFKILPYIAVIFVLGYFILASIAIFVGTLIFAIFSAFLAWLIGKIWGIEKVYRVWYLKAVHADTLYILLAWTIGFILPFTVIPFANTILVLLVLFFNDSFKK